MMSLYIFRRMSVEQRKSQKSYSSWSYERSFFNEAIPRLLTENNIRTGFKFFNSLHADILVLNKFKNVNNPNFIECLKKMLRVAGVGVYLFYFVFNSIVHFKLI